MKPTVIDPIDAALREDIGEGDLTTDFFVSKNQEATARIIARERAIVAGTETAAEVFRNCTVLLWNVVRSYQTALKQTSVNTVSLRRRC